MIAEIVKNRVGICTEDHFSALVQQEKLQVERLCGKGESS